MYKDLDGNDAVNGGANTLSDHGDLRRLGYNAPRFKVGFNADLTWQGLDFSFFLQGVGRRDWFDNSPYSVGATSHGQWQSVGFKELLGLLPT